MSKFLKIVEDVTPNEVDKVASLFNRKVVTDVNSFREKDIITLLLSDNTRVRLKITDVTGADGEEDNEGATNDQFLTTKEQNALRAASEMGATAIRRSFQKDPVKELGRAVGDLYKKLATRVTAIANSKGI